MARKMKTTPAVRVKLDFAIAMTKQLDSNVVVGPAQFDLIMKAIDKVVRTFPDVAGVAHKVSSAHTSLDMRFAGMKEFSTADREDAAELDGWELTTQGYTRGPWRIYQAETWCVAARTDCERMVARGFDSPESAAEWLKGATR